MHPALPSINVSDPGIQRAVDLLRRAGINTCQSCEGGPDHSSADPYVHFFGEAGEGWRAVAVVTPHRWQERIGLVPVSLSRSWNIQNGEPEGPFWELTFRRWP